MQRADHLSDQLRDEADLVQSIGMRGAGFERWLTTRGTANRETIAASDANGIYASFTHTFRLFLQSAMLGAWRTSGAEGRTDAPAR